MAGVVVRRPDGARGVHRGIPCPRRSRGRNGRRMEMVDGMPQSVRNQAMGTRRAGTGAPFSGDSRPASARKPKQGAVLRMKRALTLLTRLHGAAIVRRRHSPHLAS